MRKSIKALLLAAIIVTAASCATEIPVDSPEPIGGGDTEVLLRLRAPGGFATPAAPDTRALTFAQENAVNNVWVLAVDEDDEIVVIGKGRNPDFDPNGDYDGPDEYDGPAGNTDIHSGSGTFAVVMPQSLFGKTVKLVVLANAEDILEGVGYIQIVDGKFVPVAGVAVGKSYTNVRAELIGNLASGQDGEIVNSIPMWGEVTVPTLSPSASPTVELMRAVARLDVGLGTPSYDKTEEYPWSWDGEDADGNPIPFVLTGIEIGNVPNRYSLIPDLVAGDPVLTIPASAKHAESYGTEIFKNGLFTTQNIYLPEANIKMGEVELVDNQLNQSNRMAIIVSGKYNGGDETYYRLDFADVNEHFVDVYRNHLYRFNITNVDGPGYPNKLQARGSRPMNMTAQTVVVDESEFDNVVFDDQYYLAVSPQEIVFTSDGAVKSGADELKLLTDYPTWNVTMSAPGGGSVDWLTVGPNSGTDNGEAVQVIDIAVTQNTSKTIDREAVLTITAGRLIAEVKVTQECSPWAGALAAPGVIGYIKGTNKLTINGSKEYLGTPVMTDPTDTNIGTATSLATGKPLENATVYVAQFRWGSLVATRTEFYSDGGGASPALPFAPRDIVAAPKDYNNLGDADLALAAIKELAAGGPGGTNTGAAAWGTDANQTVPFRGETTGGESLGWTLDAADGLGDPCEYYFGDRWKLPMGNPWFKDGGTPFGARVTTTGWTTVNAGGNYLGALPLYGNANPTIFFGINGSVGGDGEGHPVWSMFLPAINRYRAEADGLNTSEGSARYWSSTAISSTTGATLYASSSSTSSRGNGSVFGQGLGVRCVKSTPATTLSVTPTDRTFDWDALDQSQSQVFTVAADGAWTTVIPSSAMGNFEIKQYTANGTLVTTVNYDERYAFFGFGNGTIVVTPKSNNTTSTERTFAFTVEAIGATASAAAPKTVTVTQGVRTNPGPLAAPGVIGYIHNPGGSNHHQLTIRGSKEYTGTHVMENAVTGPTDLALATGMPLEGYTVYVALFKFGSLVAMGTEYTTGNIFTARDVIAAPKDYAGAGGSAATALSMIREIVAGPSGTNSGATAWGTNNSKTVPFRSGSSARDNGWLSEPELGLGDPCAYYVDEFGSGWKLPTGNSWYNEAGSPFGTTNASWSTARDNPTYNSNSIIEGADYVNITNGAVDNIYQMPEYGIVGGTGVEDVPDWSMFLPITWERGLPGAGSIDIAGTWNQQQAMYWSSTGNTTSNGWALNGRGSNIYPNQGYNYNSGLGVRCVPMVTP